MSEHANKVAIITGASRGIGASIAERLADDGFNVVINYSGSVARPRNWLAISRPKVAGLLLVRLTFPTVPL